MSSMSPIILTTPEQAVQWLRQRVQGQLRIDNRQIQQGDGFLAWPGASVDARAFVDAALQAGALACLAERNGSEAFVFSPQAHAKLALYPNLKQDCGAIASLWYQQPSAHLDIAAVTGTNGKTSISWWVAHAMQALGRPFGLVGTLGVGPVNQLTTTGLTSPDPVRLQESLSVMQAQGMSGCVMEASSIGIEEGRLNATRIHVAALSNLSQDHLDYHRSMQAYWQAKKALFAWPSLQAAVINRDDEHGRALLVQLQREWSGQPKKHLWAYAIDATSSSQSWSLPDSCQAGDKDFAQVTELLASEVVFTASGVQFTVTERADATAAQRDVAQVQAGVTGLFNVHNLLAVIGILRSFGVALADAARVCAHLPPVPGRMQQIAHIGQPLVAVDYAHTPDAVHAALLALRPVAAQRQGRLICVFGCGGNRDASKRPLMAQAAVAGADQVWITSDNPRFENAQAIIAQILQGLSATEQQDVHVQQDRKQAIAQAIAQAQPQDVVLIAGKGHEDYQEVQGSRLHFSDMEEVQQALRQREEVQA